MGIPLYLTSCFFLFAFKILSLLFVVVQSLSYIQVFVTSWTATHQASLSHILSQSLLKFMSTVSTMPSKHLILSPLSPPALSLSQHRGNFQSVGSLNQAAKVLELQLQHQSFQWIFRIDFFRIDWYDLLAVQELLKSLLRHQSLKASILWHSAFFMIQLSHPYMTTGKAIKCTSKLTWKSTWLYLRTFPISHFGPICNRNSFLPKDVEENYNHSLTWAHTSGKNGRIMGLTVSFLMTLQRWT